MDLSGFKVRSQNTLSVISKDNQMAQDVLDFLPFYMKMRAVEFGICQDATLNKDWFMPYDYCYKNNFKRIIKKTIIKLPC